MTEKSKKTSILLLVIIALTMFVTAIFSAGEISRYHAFAAESWSVVRSSDTTAYSQSGNNLISVNSNFCVFYVRDDLTVTDNYEVSAIMTGTMTFPNTKEVQVGLVPWYVDDNNYIVVYAQWSPSDRSTQMHQVQITGKVGGNFLYGSDEWHTTWTDGIEVSPSQGIKLSVTKSGTSITFKLYNVSGTLLKTDSATISELSSTTSAKAGVYGNNDTLTFTDVSIGDISSGGGTTDPTYEAEGWATVRSISGGKSAQYLPAPKS